MEVVKTFELWCFFVLKARYGASSILAIYADFAMRSADPENRERAKERGRERSRPSVQAVRASCFRMNDSQLSALSGELVDVSVC